MPAASTRVAAESLDLDGAIRALRVHTAADREVFFVFEHEGQRTCEPMRFTPDDPRGAIVARGGFTTHVATVFAHLAVEFDVDGTVRMRSRHMNIGREESLSRLLEIEPCRSEAHIEGGHGDEIRLDSGSWFLSRASCERAVTTRDAQPFALGACRATIDHVLHDAPDALAASSAPSDDFLDRALHGGSVAQLDFEGEPLCRTFAFRPRDHVLVHDETIGAERERIAYQYGASNFPLPLIDLRGPDSRHWTRGRPNGSGHAYCARTVWIDRREGYWQIGSTRWFLTRRACAAALREITARPEAEVAALALTMRGGC